MQKVSKFSPRQSRYRHDNVYMLRIMFAYIAVNVPQEETTTKYIFKIVWGSKRKLQKESECKTYWFFQEEGI